MIRSAPFDAIIVRSATRISARVLAAAKNLKVVGRAGIGVDNIDVTAATEKGIVVLNTPDANATTTAELTIAHILSLSRHLPAADRSVRAGQWERAAFMGTEIAGKTLGILGYGTIGRLVAARGLALQMKVEVFDPFVTDEVVRKNGCRPVDLDTLLAGADYLTLHCPVTEEHARDHRCRSTGEPEKRGSSDQLRPRPAGRRSGPDRRTRVGPPGWRRPGCLRPGAPHRFPALEHNQRCFHTPPGRQHSRGPGCRRHPDCPAGGPIPEDGGAGQRRQSALRIGGTTDAGPALAGSGPGSGPAFGGAGGEGSLDRIEVTLNGCPEEIDTHLVAVDAVVGFLGNQFSGPVNQVNAPTLAQRQGIKLVEARSDRSSDYRTRLDVAGSGGGKTIRVSGTLFDERHPRLVRIEDFDIEAVLEGDLLLTRHEDRPGVAADFCRVIADAGVNITRLHLGPVGHEGRAMAVIGLEKPLAGEVLDKDAGPARPGNGASTQLRKLLIVKALVFFDCDSTLVAVEGVDELAIRAGVGEQVAVDDPVGHGGKNSAWRMSTAAPGNHSSGTRGSYLARSALRATVVAGAREAVKCLED